tara:strand:- start:25 stop:198 length:174 start_codon:yes stop_codon:yes gene_type:complete
MLLRKKGNEIFFFEDEEELKEYCSDSRFTQSMFQHFDIQKYDKKQKRFIRTKSSIIK